MKAFIIVGAIAAGLVAAPCLAQTQIADGALKPYLQVKTVKGEEDAVRVYFSPSCQYSRSYLPFFKNLEATLPARKRFEFTPLVNKLDGLEYALGFYAVKTYYPRYLGNFIEASLLGVQDHSITTRSWAGLRRIGVAARLPEDLPKLVDKHKDELQKMVSRELVVQKSLEITNTPSVAVAGTYIVTPEFTSGDMALFSQLVNGVISMTP